MPEVDKSEVLDDIEEEETSEDESKEEEEQEEVEQREDESGEEETEDSESEEGGEASEEESKEESQEDTEEQKRIEDSARHFRMLDELNDTPNLDQTIHEPEILSRLEFDEIEYISDKDMDSIVNTDGSLDRDSLNKAFNKVGVQAFKQSLKALPAVYSALQKENNENQSVAKKFYAEDRNAMLSPYDDIMAKIVGKLKAKNPTMKTQELLEQARTKTVTLLGLKEKIISSKLKPGKQKGARPPGGKGKGKPSSKQTGLTALQKQMNENLG